ncbi:DEAD/DEAH box helicase [Nakamurella antarctica]|uniref:DEAD/DEAH box helicase n=1 Tax=Nakamurella antarctica TaxID=1902245 RepID=A0A3G8ZY45_9ACTN|nr:DEAD/DEAH box helicase [Nakamurella antarctica]AZI58946.1 DEAD/DEAH box helicase [Nakamurella antarctica]
MAASKTAATQPKAAGADAFDPAAALQRFSPLVAGWFTSVFAEPTPAQAGAWDAIGRGDHTLVVAPTGSGKTLAAFLSAINTLVEAGPEVGPAKRCRVLYLSPLKALAVDVERNLRSPLAGIAVQAQLKGVAVPAIEVAIRSGDTPVEDRRSFARKGADILITTPESLFLILTSKAREMLAGVDTVILDEVHAVAGTKRGAHLAVSLDRLDALLDKPAQRIGLSATVRPLSEVGRFLTGGRPVTMVQPPSTKKIDVEVQVPVADLAELGAPTGDLTGTAAGQVPLTSIWPHVEERIVDLIGQHRSTIVFANSRRLAERLTARLNEIHAERLGAAEGASENQPPAQLMGGSGLMMGASPTLAKAHHGSVSRTQRAIVEDELKSGLLPAVVATSSLELGIDMGAVDLVIQVETPPSVASGLQRIGRAGHQVGAASHGIMFPKYRGDLVASAVVSERMLVGAVEALAIVTNPLDVLAQQIVAIVALDDIAVEELHELLRKSAPFAALPRSVLEAVLDMLSGRYPSEEFAELRPRLVWDRITGTLTGRPGAQRLAITSGGTIPDRGMYGVFLATGEGPGRRVGELDEEMVYESRVGDVFALGSSSWQIVDITHDQVKVLPAPGRPGRLPFWRGDGLGRPAELGRAHGAFLREIGNATDVAARQRLTLAGLDTWAADNLLAYLNEQKQSTGALPDEKTIVVERFRDELGDWRVVLHSPFGAAVHAPWAMSLAARMRERYGVDVQAMHADDGIVLRLPDLEYEGGSPEVADLAILEPTEIEADVTREIGGSALFASRFRECAARALLLPRRQVGRRQPLWQQRQRASQLLEVASKYPTFPIVAEAVRECLQDVFDVPGLISLMQQIAGRSVRVVEVETSTPSPFAKSLMFGYVAQFLYDGDTPLAERRAAALAVDPALLADLLGHGDGLALRDLLDPVAIEQAEKELQRLIEGRQARNADEAADLLRVLGPQDAAEIALRSTDPSAVPDWLAHLLDARRIAAVRIAGVDRYADISDIAALRDGVGVPVPLGVAQAFLQPSVDPLGHLLGRYSRVRGPFTAAQAAERFGLGQAVATDALRRLVGTGRLVQGEFRPTAAGGIEGAEEYVDAEVLRLLRRRSLAALRAEVEPVPPAALAQFLPAWNGIGPSVRRNEKLRGAEGLLRAVEQLAGAVVPASALETLILPARVNGYTPALLDELTAAGEVLWVGHGSMTGNDCWVSLHLADTASLTLPLPLGEGAVGAPAVPGKGAAAKAGAKVGGAKAGGAKGSAAKVGGAKGDAVSGPAAPDLAVTDPILAAELDEVPVSTRPQQLHTSTSIHEAILRVLAGGGAYFFRALSDAVCTDIGLTNDGPMAEALWDLVFSAQITGDTAAPLRARLAGGKTAHKTAPAAPRSRLRGLQGLSTGRAAAMRSAGRQAGLSVTKLGPPTVAGRWSLLPAVELDPTIRAHATAEVLLDRYGIVTRGSVVAEEILGGFAGVYRVLAAFEEAGRTRRGYFVEGLGAAQFGSAGAIDRLRTFVDQWGAASGEAGKQETADSPTSGSAAHAGNGPVPWQDNGFAAAAAAIMNPGGALVAPQVEALVLAATDPASPFGAALPWPEAASEEKHRPSRRAGALVAMANGELVFYAERGGKTLLVFTESEAALNAAAAAIAAAIGRGGLGAMTIQRINGEDALLASGAVPDALSAAGFAATPRGLRLRAGVR